MTGPKPCDPDPAGAVTPATRPNWAICTIAVREVDEGLVRTESAIDFLLEQWERPRDDRRQGRQSVGEYSVSRIDIRADDLLISADPDVRGQADYETSRMQITRFGVT